MQWKYYPFHDNKLHFCNQWKQVLTHTPLTPINRVQYPALACENVMWSPSQKSRLPLGILVTSYNKSHEARISVPMRIICKDWNDQFSNHCKINIALNLKKMMFCPTCNGFGKKQSPVTPHSVFNSLLYAADVNIHQISQKLFKHFTTTDQHKFDV